MSVSQEDGEKLTSIFKIKDGVKWHRMGICDTMGRSGEGCSGASPVNLGPLGKLEQTIPKEIAGWVSLPLSTRHGQSQGKVIQESVERKPEN